MWMKVLRRTSIRKGKIEIEDARCVLFGHNYLRNVRLYNAGRSFSEPYVIKGREKFRVHECPLH